MRFTKFLSFAIFAFPLLSFSAAVWAAETPAGKAGNVDGIKDNSFLVEEAYNQEAGVVQHITTVTRGVDRADQSDRRSWNLAFTQEWPLGSQDHQFSYTVPYVVETGNDGNNGPRDVLLNYRYQLSMETDCQPAIAPRLSALLPTGNMDEGFGSDAYGLQFNLPVSKSLTDKVQTHFNAGLTYLPGVRMGLSDETLSPQRDLMGYNLGASVIYAVFPKLHFMLEGVTNWDHGIDSDTGGRTESLSAIISPGIRYAVDTPGGVQLVFGLGIPVGLTRDATDYGVLLYLSIEHDFMDGK